MIWKGVEPSATRADYHFWPQLNEVGERRDDGHKRFWMRAVVIIDGGES